MTPDTESTSDSLPTTRGRKLLFGALALVLGVVIGLVIAEATLRIMGYSSPQFYETDEVLGYKLIPGLSGWYTKEGRSYVTINSDGFHDVEHALPKPADTVRIAVVGDSYVEAFQVGRDAAFTNFITSEARDCGAFDGKNVEVLRFGVSGYGTAQERLLLREKVLRYSPDIVMLVMTTNNDVTDNLRELKETPIPYYVLQDGELVADEGFRGEKGFLARSSAISRLGTWLENNLRFVQAIREITRKTKEWYRRPAAASATDAQASMPATEIGIDSQVYREPSDETWKKAWQVTEAIVAAMRSDVQNSGARFMLVTASNGVQVLPHVEQRAVFAERLGVDDLYYPDRRITQFGRANGIPVMNLAPYLAEHSAREKVNLHGFEGNVGYGHWNQLGHRVAGKELGKWLCEAARF